MKEEGLKKLAEEVAEEKPLDAELDEAEATVLRNHVGKMGNVFHEQFKSYHGKMGLGAFLAYVYHEGIQLGLKLAIWKRRLRRRL